jgi:hypothetical protein
MSYSNTSRRLAQAVLLFLFLHTTVVGGVLRDESELSLNCYNNFPTEDFGRTNSVKNTYGSSPHVVLGVGEQAIDFTLPTLTGELVNLKVY